MIYKLYIAFNLFFYFFYKIIYIYLRFFNIFFVFLDNFKFFYFFFQFRIFHLVIGSIFLCGFEREYYFSTILNGNNTSLLFIYFEIFYF
jgi:hypothetical protein